MADSSLTRFRCLGRFESFVAGKKSPYKKIALQAVQFDNATGELVDSVQVKLGKTLRRELPGYLEAGDWVKVSGKGKADLQADEITYKAKKVVKLSSRQAKQQQKNFDQRVLAEALADDCPPGNQVEKKSRKKPKKQKKEKQAALEPLAKSKLKPPKVLICQKGSCRQKGSVAVCEAIAAELEKAGRSDDIKIKATGCMKHCKAGPNMVIMPAGDSYKKVTPKKARSLIQQVL